MCACAWENNREDDTVFRDASIVAPVRQRGRGGGDVEGRGGDTAAKNAINMNIHRAWATPCTAY